MAKTLRLNPIRCDGYGICAFVLPERIRLDEWGYPIVDSRPIEDHRLADARRTVDLCPVLALSLRQVIDPASHARETPGEARPVGGPNHLRTTAGRTIRRSPPR